MSLHPVFCSVMCEPFAASQHCSVPRASHCAWKSKHSQGLLRALSMRWCYVVLQLQPHFLSLFFMRMRPCRRVCQMLEQKTKSVLAAVHTAMYASVQTCVQVTNVILATAGKQSWLRTNREITRLCQPTEAVSIQTDYGMTA